MTDPYFLAVTGQSKPKPKPKPKTKASASSHEAVKTVPISAVEEVSPPPLSMCRPCRATFFPPF